MTTLTFEQDAVRLATDALLKSLTNIKVYLGAITDDDGNPQTVSTVYPYLLRGAVMPFETNFRTGGRGSLTRQFLLQCVHIDDGACEDVAAGVRDYLRSQSLTVNGREYHIRLSDPSAPITVLRDETWTRPDGGLLFYASDRWNVL